ncbi:hypothetical protein KL86DYS2_11842 [uncultured Dysgonomonas sp.]|uniref:Uncharacterized protein n=1 Tax=uncultured Dysgonomonas sp. TaxID=206096 RepID=A0A212J3F2_9BACT|nr:hypothetical protein KL86DYS2_10643 [uncultured Dysgonomonas sp.]SBW00374.1 hypothetical protein KL86DYS2_11842 [uncultured Dysgonomonas sp.]
MRLEHLLSGVTVRLGIIGKLLHSHMLLLRYTWFNKPDTRETKKLANQFQVERESQSYSSVG